MKNRVSILILIGIIEMCCLGLNFSCSQSIKLPRILIQSDEQGSWVLEDKQKVLFYQKTTKSLDGKYPRANYVHPLLSLDGNTLTEDFPDDHLPKTISRV